MDGKSDGETSGSSPTPAERSSSSGFLGWLPKRFRFSSKKRHKRRSRPSPDRSFSSMSPIHFSEISKFTLEELKAATHNFADMIGNYDFREVYQGILSNGSLVSIKVSNSSIEQEKAKFSTEIFILSNVKHQNIVKFLGYCIDGDVLMTVYELAEIGSLHDLLFGYNKYQIQIDWQTSRKICLGVAKGLCYLHEEVNPNIVHRDIKPSSILLDIDLNPKIANFELSVQNFYEDNSFNTRVIETSGYIDPEYLSTGLLTPKSDVYSFGVMLLEIVSGRRASEDNFKLVEQVHDLCQKEENLLKLVDKRLFPACPMHEAFAILRLGVECTNYSTTERPTMSDVVSIMEGLQGNEKKLHPRLLKYTQILSSLDTLNFDEFKRMADQKREETKYDVTEVSDKSFVLSNAEIDDSSPCPSNVETEAREPFDPSNTEDLDVLLSTLSDMVVLPKATVEVTPVSDSMAKALETFGELKNLMLGINFREALQVDTKFKILHIHEAIGCSALPDHQSHILDRLMNFLVQTEELSAAISTQDERSLYIAKYDSIKQKLEETKKGGKDLQERASKLRTSIASIEEEMVKLQQKMDDLRNRQANEENELSEIRRIAASNVKEAAPHASWLVKEFDKRSAAGRELQEVEERLGKVETDWNAIQDLLRS